MRFLLFVVCASFSALAASKEVEENSGPAQNCFESDCLIEDNCRCSSNVSPLPSSSGQSPQLIGLTFDEAVTDDIFNDYWYSLLFSRANPDGIPIGATFFVPHEYTDYERVNDLYNYGFEIGVHSITKNNDQEYWRNATQELLRQEFEGQRQIISKFANIPAEDILGVRTPQLQLAGDFSIGAFVDSGLVYDSSWPSLSNNRLYPYTLDYKSTQDCSLGAQCPNESFEGFWVLPINNIHGFENKECNTMTSCEINGTVAEISSWLLGEIEQVAATSRVPLTLIVESTWFHQVPNAFEALGVTLDQLIARGDTYIVTLKQILDWTKNPVPADQFITELPDNAANCRPVTCPLVNQDGEERYMKSCVTCPSSYPWLGNPNGDPQ